MHSSSQCSQTLQTTHSHPAQQGLPLATASAAPTSHCTSLVKKRRPAVACAQHVRDTTPARLPGDSESDALAAAAQATSTSLFAANPYFKYASAPRRCRLETSTTAAATVQRQRVDRRLCAGGRGVYHSACDQRRAAVLTTPPQAEAPPCHIRTAGKRTSAILSEAQSQALSLCATVATVRYQAGTAQRGRISMLARTTSQLPSTLQADYGGSATQHTCRCKREARLTCDC